MLISNSDDFENREMNDFAALSTGCLLEELPNMQQICKPSISFMYYECVKLIELLSVLFGHFYVPHSR